MKLISILLFFTLSLNPKVISNHEFHISKCLIEYSEDQSALQFSVHIFIDDLEEALRQQGADKLFICTEKEHKEAEKYITRYLHQKLKIEVDDQLLDYNFIGKEISEDLAAVWCYLEIPQIHNPKKLMVSNSILMEVFDDQKNIVNIVAPNQKRGYFLFHKGNSTDSLHLD